MHAAARANAEFTSVQLGDLLRKRSIFTINNERFPRGIRYTENPLDYVWGKPMMRMMLEVQCLAVAIIVTTQVWILAYYGARVFEKLVGDDIALPLLYLFAIVSGTMTYVRPTYWRIVLSLTLYSLAVYFSLMVTNMALEILVTPGLAEALQDSAMNARVWVPWAIGFVLHLHISISSAVMAFVSLRDMYRFSPVIWTGTPEVLAKHNIIVEPITIVNRNPRPDHHPHQEPTAMIVQYI